MWSPLKWYIIIMIIIFIFRALCKQTKVSKVLRMEKDKTTWEKLHKMLKRRIIEGAELSTTIRWDHNWPICSSFYQKYLTWPSALSLMWYRVIMLFLASHHRCLLKQIRISQTLDKVLSPLFLRTTELLEIMMQRDWP